MSDRGCCLRWLLTVALAGDRRWRCGGCFFFFSSASPCFFVLWLFAYSTAPLVSFLSLLWCWGRRSRWWCWVSSAGFLLPWPSLLLFSCYRFLVLLPLVLADGAVERWSWWWFFFLFFSAGWTFSRRVILAWSGSCVIFQTLFPPVAPVPPFSCSFFFCFCLCFPFPSASCLYRLPLCFFFRLSLPSSICLSCVSSLSLLLSRFFSPLSFSPLVLFSFPPLSVSPLAFIARGCML